MLTSSEEPALKDAKRKLREKIENAYTDVFIEFEDREDRIIVYSDPGGTSVDTEGDYHYFDNYDEMLKASVFWGHKLEEIVDRIEYYY